KGALSGGEGGNLLEEARAEQALPNTLNGVQVWINDEAVPLFFAGEGQVNFLVPTDLEPGTASMVVTVNGVPSDLVAFPVVEAAPELFTLPAEIAGPGRAVIQNEDFSVVTPDN